MMQKAWAQPNSGKCFGKAAAALLLLAAIAMLSGCQGVSAGGKQQQQIQIGTLSVQASLNFGSVAPGSNASLALNATNSGTATVNIQSIAISTKYFAMTAPSLPITIAAGQTVPLNMEFSPNASGAFNATLTMASDASDASASVALSGTGAATAGALGPNPASLNFGSVQVGTNQSMSETVTNNGGTSITISQVGASGSGFSVSGITVPATLTAGQSTSFNVTFTPQSAAAASGSVTVSSNATNPTLTISLTGTGTSTPGTLAANPTTLPVGSVTDGQSGTTSGSLVASGSNVTVTAASSNNAAFSISGLTLPVTIQAGQSAPFTVTFSPQSAGSASATLTFTSNASPASTQATATGTGTAPQTHTVSLSWTGSTSSNISGYNIYRAAYSSSCGSFSKINSLLNTGTLYTDSTVTNGSSYCYAATAVDTSNVESGYSNIVSAVQIPAN